MTILSTLWLLPLLSLVVLFLLLVSLRHCVLAAPRPSAKRLYWRSVLVLGGVVTAVRVAICWYLTYRTFSHNERLSEVPLIALLMPEYLLAPGDLASPAGMWA